MKQKINVYLARTCSTQTMLHLPFNLVTVNCGPVSINYANTKALYIYCSHENGASVEKCTYRSMTDLCGCLLKIH